MNPSTTLRLGLFLGLVLLGLLAAWLWRGGMETEAAGATSVVGNDQRAAPESSRPAPDPLLIGDLSLALPPPPGALPRQAIWRIRSDEDTALLERALRSGLRIRGRIESLGLVLLEGDPALLGRLSAEASEVNFNYPAFLPRLPDKPHLASAEPVQDRLLDFLLLPDRPEDWGRGVRIALLDTGVADHPALETAKIESIGEAGDDNGHGTAVASLLVGNHAAARGLAPGAELLVYKVLGADGQSDTFTIAEAIVSAANRGAGVISLSAGSRADSAALREAVDYATSRGSVVVAAAGNDGASTLLYPAAYDAVVAVGAIDGHGTPAAFSNRGSTLDLSAPGVGLYSAYLDDQYVEFSGTSAAVPVVSGAIAAIAGANPLMNTTQALQALLDTADDAGASGWDPVTGYGIVDPLRVIEGNQLDLVDVGVSAPDLATAPTSQGSTSVTLNVENRGNQFVGRAVVRVEVDGVATEYPITGLNVDESRPITVVLPTADLEDANGISFRVTTTVGQGQTDARENDHYDLVLKLDSDDEPDDDPAEEPEP